MRNTSFSRLGLAGRVVVGVALASCSDGEREAVETAAVGSTRSAIAGATTCSVDGALRPLAGPAGLVAITGEDPDGDGLPAALELSGAGCGGATVRVTLGADASAQACGLCFRTGTAGADTLAPAAGCAQTVFFAGPGDDTVLGGAGADALYGGAGNDRLDANDGDNLLVDCAGANELKALHGDDLFFGGSGRDVMYGRGGNDRMYGGAGNDTLSGEEGDDVLVGGPGNDDLRGLWGNDRIAGGPGDDILKGWIGADCVQGDEGNDEISGGPDDDRVLGGPGDDVLNSREGSDVLVGGPGRDTFNAEGGDDLLDARDGEVDAVLSGGDGNNVVYADESDPPASSALVRFEALVPAVEGCIPEDGEACDDGSVCTTGDAWHEARCAGTPISCDDGDDCTADSCDPAGGCRHTPTGTCCGNGTCNAGESATTCPADCPAACGDGACTAGETACACAADCAATCGDGCCTGGESARTCAGDCPARCGDGFCSAGETGCACPSDCAARCGDGCCTAGENACGCPADCASACGDACCDASETASGCAADCGCGDGRCDASESSATCPADCGSRCGDAVCNGGETCGSCARDCGDCPILCGDRVCSAPDEDCASCAADCGDCPRREAGTRCGDGVCEPGEDGCACPADCGAADACGDGACNGGETDVTCGQDCDVARPATPGPGATVQVHGAVFLGGPGGLPLALQCGGATLPLRPASTTTACELCVILGGSGRDRLAATGCAAPRVVMFGGAGDDRLSGAPDRENFLFGGDGKDELYGGAHADVLVGDGGDDRIAAAGGDDRIWAGDGNDRVEAGPGNDRVWAGAGNDDVAGADGNDLLYGEAGGDKLRGDGGDDALRGGADSDVLLGGAGNDLLEGEGGNDALRGDGGDDVLRGGDGSDRLAGDDGHDCLGGGPGIDILEGGNGNDRLRGDEGSDFLRGGSGDDLLDGGPGEDSLEGNHGDDVLDAHDQGLDRQIKGDGGADLIYRDALERVLGDNADVLIAAPNPLPLAPCGCAPSATGCPGTRSPEICDGLDNDCDLLVDEADGPGGNRCGGVCALAADPGEACDGADADRCAEGMLACAARNALTCAEAPGAIVEECNGADDDCDGEIDEGGAEHNGCGGACPLAGTPGTECATAAGESGEWCCDGANGVACLAGGCERFAVIADWGQGGAVQLETRDALVNHCASKGCDYVLTAGDNFYSNGVRATCDPIWHERFERMYAALDVPFYAILGNHDYYGNEQAQIDYTDLGGHCGFETYTGNWLMPDHYYSFEQGQVGFFMLDTNLTGQALLTQQNDMLDRIESSKAAWKVVVGHHPLVSSRRTTNARGALAAALDTLLCRPDGTRRVDAYIFGDGHYFDDLTHTRCGVRLIGVGAAGAAARRYAPIANSHFTSGDNGFMWTEVMGNRLHFEFVNKAGQVIHDAELTR